MVLIDKCFITGGHRVIAVFSQSPARDGLAVWDRRLVMGCSCSLALSLNLAQRSLRNEK
jgi:hypothetical protein